MSTKQETVMMRVSTDLANRIKTSASNKGLSVSSFLRMISIEKLNQEMTDDQYLRSNKTNKDKLDKAINRIENNNTSNSILFNGPEDLQKYVDDITG